jgi:hypothetical protein
VADDARELIAQAERDAESGDPASALRALERAYVPVQKARDVETSERALALARRLAEESSLGGGDRRKARGIVSWYQMLVRGHAQGGAPSVPPSLTWIDSLVVILSLFVVLELIGGVLVAVGSDSANARIAAIAAAIIGATMLLALIAVIRLLQAIERNTRSSEPGDAGSASPA